MDCSRLNRFHHWGAISTMAEHAEIPSSRTGWCSVFSSTIDRFNEKRRNTGGAGEDAGFTLIELMVVLLILAILLAIAIPTFLGVTKSANDRAAQSNLNTAFLNAKAAYQAQGQSYTSTSVTNAASLATALAGSEPSLTFGTTNSATQANISVQVSTDGHGLVLAAFSKSSNNCWLIYDNPVAPTQTTDAPWTGTTTGSNGTSTGVLTTADTIVVPSQLGTSYAEIKGASVTGMAADCLASQPVAPVGSTYEWSTTAFPAL
jgi:type IV pilus assembly protein PilA